MAYRGQSGVRTEKLADEWFDYTTASSTVTEFYKTATDQETDGTVSRITTDNDMETQSSGSMRKKTSPNQDYQKMFTSAGSQKVMDLPKCSLSCLSALLHHLKVFKLQQVLQLIG